MTEQQTAAAALKEIARTRQRTIRAVIYDVSSSILILWGLLTAAGYLIGHVQPRQAGPVWIAIFLAGFIGTGLIVQRHHLAGEQRFWAWRIGAAQMVLVGYGLVLLLLFWPVTPRQLNAFWPSLFMFGYMLAGLWVGRFFFLCGLFVIALTMIGYFWAGDLFGLWMAVVEGVALLLGGWWLRRAGAAL